jgi:hypothetical protein
MLRRAFVLLQLEAACAGFNLLVWIVPTPINKYRHLFVHISFFLYLSPYWRLYLRHTSCAALLLLLVMCAAAVDALGCPVLSSCTKINGSK